MKKDLLRISSFLLALSVSTSIMAGCSSKKASQSSTSNTKQVTNVQKSGKLSEKPITLTYWVNMDVNAAQVLSNYGEMEMFKKMEEISNIKINFKHPPIGQDKEQFSLMIASGDLPDMMEHGWIGFPGGPELAIKNNIIIKLNDLVDKNAPNLKKLLDSDPNVNRQSRTDNQSLYAFPSVGVGNVKITGGPVIRKDWLDDLGLKSPETADDWTNILTQFKEKKGASAPLTGLPTYFTLNDTFSCAFNISNKYYLDNGKVKYGPVQPAYKQYLEQLRVWYKLGLLDPDFASNNAKSVDSKMTTGKSGASYAAIGGGIGTYMNLMKDKDSKYSLVAAQYPVQKKGESPMFVPRAWEVRETNMLAITTANKYPTESARWADYFYGNEGNLLKNFGVEGSTYKMEKDSPKYTDLILNNPQGLSVAQAMGKYMRVSTAAPGLIDSRYYEQYYTLAQQKDALNLWSKVSDNALKVLVPPISADEKESEELSNITSTIESYRNEMFLKFVMGVESLDNFDKYVDQIKKMKIDRVIELKQIQLERYNKR